MRMINRVQATLRAPVFADRSSTRQARIVHNLILAMMGMLLIAVPAVLVTGLPQSVVTRFLVAASVAFLGLVTWFVVLRWGHVKLAAVGILAQIAVSALVAMTTLSMGATLVPVVALLLLVPIAGLLFGTKGVWGALAFVLLALTGVMLIVTIKPLTPLVAPYSFVTWLLLLGVLALYGFAESMNARVLSERLDDATRLAQDLAAKNAELESARNSLEERVDERTTELTSVNLALRTGEARYRALFETAPESIVVIRLADRRVVDANPPAARLFGYSLTDLIGKTALELSAPVQADGTPSGVNQGFLERAARGEQVEREWTIVAADGREIPVELRAIVLPSGANDAVRVTIIDISQRKQYESQLRQREAVAQEFQQRLKQLHDVNTALSQVTEMDALFRKVVGLGLSHLGFERLALFLIEETLSHSTGTFGTDISGGVRNEYGYAGQLAPQVRKLLVEQPLESMVWHDVPLLDYGQTVGWGWSLFAVLRHEPRPVGYLVADNLLTGEPLRPYQPELLALYGATVAHHVERIKLAGELERRASELQAANRELEEYRAGLETLVAQRTGELAVAKDVAESANLAKTSFMATMSHELRTPLNAVIGFLQLLQSNTELSALQERYVSIMEQSALHLMSLVNDALQWSKLDTGQETVSKRRFNPGKLLAEVAEVFRPNAVQKGLDLMVDCDTMPDVVADERKLRQVLANLVTNSVRYTVQGHVILRCALNASGDVQQTLTCTVSDTGRGIAPEDLERIFHPFVRMGDDELIPEGSGLGLTIVKQLLDVMEGEISVVSQLGQSTEFQVSVPVVLAGDDDMLMATTMPLGAANLEALRGKEVLVVEDIAVNRLLLADMLEPLGLHIKEASTGRAALDSLESGMPELALVDIKLPDMSGLDVIARIRQLPAGNCVTIIVLSAQAVETGEADAMAAGGDVFLRKPFLRDDLLSALARHLARGDCDG